MKAIAAIIPCVLLTGCIFAGGGGGEGTLDSGNDDLGRTDAGAETVDTGGPDGRTDGGAVDMDSPDGTILDLGSPRPDMSGSDFVYDPRPTYDIVFPGSFDPSEPSDGFNDDEQAMRHHIRLGWSGGAVEVDSALAFDPGAAMPHLAILTRSSRVDDRELPDFWDNPSFPTIVAHPYILDDALLYDWQDDDRTGAGTLELNESSVLAIGLGAELKATRAPQLFSVPPGDLLDIERVASLPENGGPVVFRLAAGSRLHSAGADVFGEPTVAGRVAWGLTGATDFEPDTWWMFDNAVAHLLGESLSGPFPAECGIVVSGIPNAFDFALVTRARRNGCDTRLLRETDLPGEDEIIIISPALPVEFVDRFVAHPAPVVVLYDAVSKLDRLRLADGSVAAVRDTNNWVLSTAERLLYWAPDTMSIATAPVAPLAVSEGTMAPGAIVLARPATDLTTVTGMLVPEGSALVNGESAAGDRIALAGSQSVMRPTTKAYLSLVDAAIQWSMHRSPVGD